MESDEPDKKGTHDNQDNLDNNATINQPTNENASSSNTRTTYFETLKNRIDERDKDSENRSTYNDVLLDPCTRACNTEYDIININEIKSLEAEGTSNASIIIEEIEAKVSNSSSSSGGLCRICYEGKSKEALISPCKCMGTMGYLHRSCIEKWLGSSNSNKCEICNFEYVTVRRPKPVSEWLCRPMRRSDRRNLWADTACFLLLTPLAGVSAWLCASGAMAYAASYEDGEWEAIGLAALSVFLVSIYFVWCGVAMKYHYSVFRHWSEHNQDVRVMDLDQLEENNPRLNPDTSEPQSSASQHTVLSLD